MSCWSAHCCATKAHFDAKIAERDLRRYKRSGADAVTRLLLSELRQRPLRGHDLLDVGAGIGMIAAEMAKNGVAKATVVEASPAYLDAARQEVGSRYGERCTRFVLGDFTMIAASLADADIVTLGRVVCCYPDARALLHEAAARTRHTLAFTYPRYRWYVRAGNLLQNLFRRWKGNAFRTYIHLPRAMERALEDAGLFRVTRKQTLIWALDIYERRQANGG
jgi:SAM-dependent methyltransferase